IQRISTWVTERGLQGAGETELLNGFCDSCRAAGIELERVIALIDTLHPVHEGRAFRWRASGMGGESAMTEYGRTSSGEGSAAWQRTPFYHLLTTDGDELRRRIGFGDPLDFDILREMAELGLTDYVALVHRFAGEGSIGEMDCFYSQWTTSNPNGFSDAQI